MIDLTSPYLHCHIIIIPHLYHTIPAPHHTCIFTSPHLHALSHHHTCMHCHIITIPYLHHTIPAPHHTCIVTSPYLHCHITTPACIFTSPHLHALPHHHTCMHCHITTPACIFTSPHLHCYDRFHTYLHCWLYPLSLRRGNRQLSLCRYMHACVCVCVCVCDRVFMCECVFFCVYLCECASVWFVLLQIQLAALHIFAVVLLSIPNLYLHRKLLACVLACLP